MVTSIDLNKRLKQLGWRVFHLAKLVSEIRAKRGTTTTASRINSTIAKAIDNPAKSSLETLNDVVTALGGEINIVWEPESVITIRLSSELREVLVKRARRSGLTISQMTEQLLQQALTSQTQSQETQSVAMFDGHECVIDTTGNDIKWMWQDFN